MITRDKITEIFCMANDFCKLFDHFIKANGIAPKRDKFKRKYHRDPKMSSGEIITIMILFHLSGYKCFKHFCINEVQEHMTDLFPNTVSYNRFTELERSVVIPFTLCEEMLHGEMYRNQFCRQHVASRIPEPAYSYAQGL